MKTSINWKNFKNKEVRLLVDDFPHPRPRDGTFIDIDDTHIFLKVKDKLNPVPFARNKIKRVELKNE